MPNSTPTPQAHRNRPVTETRSGRKAPRERGQRADNRASDDSHVAKPQVAHAIIDQLARTLSTNRGAIELAVMTLCAGGHLLLEDVPGIGKTTLARALATSVQARVNRIQFTSDMLPSDLTGVSVFDQQARRFSFVPGPLFADMVLADEINRANPKTQAAMLEAMGEGRVSVDGTSYELPRPYFVIATQNPVDMEGTYPLPEAQLDRFTARISLGYPSVKAEAAMLVTPSGTDPVTRVQPICTTTDLRRIIAQVARVHVSPAVAEYAVALLGATRTHPAVRLGASPRAGLALLAMSRARAWLRGQEAVFPGDVRAMAIPTLAHRILFSTSAGSAGIDGGRALDRQQALLTEVIKTVPAPRA